MAPLDDTTRLTQSHAISPNAPVALSPTDLPARIGARLTAARWGWTLSALAGLSVVAGLAALRFGAEPFTFHDMARILSAALAWRGTAEDTDPASVILLQVRLPRILLAYLVGGCLAAVGVGLQALLRNPLADPYVLGISSGAALGAAVATLLGVGAVAFTAYALPLCAMLGGLLSILIIYRIAATYGRLPVHILLLAGVILNAIFSALIMFITSILEPTRSFGLLQWLMGSLTAPGYPLLAVLTCYVVVGGLILFRQARALNLLTLGDEAARSLGVDAERVKKTVFFASAFLTGAVVSVSGMIGFVGMVVPHAVRMVLGPDHRLLLPASTMVGGAYLVIADTLARSLLAPSELPVGVITALAGGPFFIYLLMNRKSGIRL